MKKEVPGAPHAHPLPRLASDIRLAPACSRRLIHSEELLDDDGRLLIEHNGKLYLLRSLPGGRLILTGWDSKPARLIGNRTALR